MRLGIPKRSPAGDASASTLISGRESSASGASNCSETSLGFTSPNVSCSLSRHDLSQRFSSVPSAADDRTIHPALVWRRTCRVERLPIVLPGLPAGWLRLRSLAGLAAEYGASG